MQEAGLIDYTHFQLVCGCSEYKKAEFDSTIASMEKNLAEWQKNVEKYRKQYPHLNYYTSQQLLDLRKELGKLKKDPKSFASHALKQLLLSVTPNPSQSKIASALTNAVKTMSNKTSSVRMQVQQKNNFSGKSAVPSPTFDLIALSKKRKEILKALRDDYDSKVSVILAAFSELEEDADDPLLLEPLEEGYSLEIAIEAVQKAKQNPQLAREISFDYVEWYIENSASFDEHEW